MYVANSFAPSIALQAAGCARNILIRRLVLTCQRRELWRSAWAAAGGLEHLAVPRRGHPCGAILPRRQRSRHPSRHLQPRGAACSRDAPSYPVRMQDCLELHVESGSGGADVLSFLICNRRQQHTAKGHKAAAASGSSNTRGRRSGPTSNRRAAVATIIATPPRRHEN